jgi:aryl-alcohol dehydrogenase-like predicted oxidoreductase
MLHQQIKKLGYLSVSTLGLGCANLSGLYGDISTDGGEILRYAFDNGINFFDTADVYANGRNEELIAASFAKYNIPRNQVLLSSKCGVVWDNQSRLANSVNNSPQYIKRACEASLKRLNTDYIDLYYLHRISSNGDQIEESMQTLKELVEEGKIRHVGLSEVNKQIIQRASAVCPLSAIQSEYSLLTRDPEINGVLDTCRELSIGFVAYSPLCRGLLANDFSYSQLDKNDFRHKLPRFKKDNLENNMRIVKQLEKMAHDKKCTIVQLSLAWVFSKGDYVFPIPGTKSIKHLRENIAASHIILTDEDKDILNQLFPIGVASGDRYSPAILRTFNMSAESK